MPSRLSVTSPRYVNVHSLVSENRASSLGPLAGIEMAAPLY